MPFLVTPAPNLAWFPVPARILVARCWLPGFVVVPLRFRVWLPRCGLAGEFVGQARVGGGSCVRTSPVAVIAWWGDRLSGGLIRRLLHAIGPSGGGFAVGPPMPPRRGAAISVWGRAPGIWAAGSPSSLRRRLAVDAVISGRAGHRPGPTVEARGHAGHFGAV